MLRTLGKNWWLLALCAVLEGIISVINFSHVGHGFHSMKDVAFAGRLAMAAGVFAIAAGIWKFASGKGWLLVVNGLALGVFGLILNGIFGSGIRFSTIALLIIVMAMSLGVCEWEIARTVRRQLAAADRWILRLAGAASFAFAVAFFVLGVGWIKIEPGSYLDLRWMGAYFAFSAICMLGLGLRLNGWLAAMHRVDGDPSAPFKEANRPIAKFQAVS
jgi:uncharacterized membrane protein HdeD (DUF308 family)